MVNDPDFSAAVSKSQLFLQVGLETALFSKLISASVTHDKGNSILVLLCPSLPLSLLSACSEEDLAGFLQTEDSHVARSSDGIPGTTAPARGPNSAKAEGASLPQLMTSLAADAQRRCADSATARMHTSTSKALAEQATT